MPPRVNKRQQREKEELVALTSQLELHEHDKLSEDEAGLQNKSRGVISFAALAKDVDEQDDDSMGDDDGAVQVSKPKKSKKKKRAGISAGDVPALTKVKPKVQDVVKSKAKLKAEKDKDFDEALVELSGRYSTSKTPEFPEATSTTSSSQASFDVIISLLSVSLKHLDPETELRRFFGPKVIALSTSSRPSRVRSYLTRPQPAWPPAQYRAGLSMRALTSEEVGRKGAGVGSDSRERWWTIEASPRYKGTTYEYLQCVMGGDPHLFYNLMYEMPWHADTLLQMAEVFRHREEYSTGADFTSRALFAYERAFAGAFNVTTGVHRLDFDRVENRVFYLALARNIIDLNRRGTPRTAFEFARLLFALDPHTDPHGALLHLDSLAFKAGQGAWLLSMWNTYLEMNTSKDSRDGRFDVTVMPGWCWTRALVLFVEEGGGGHKESIQALKDAIIAFPSIASLLADKLELAVHPELRKMDAFKIITDYSAYHGDHSTSLVSLLSHIYVMRSHPLWKPPTRTAWLLKTLNSLDPSLFVSSTPPLPRRRLQTLFVSSNVTEAIYRHVVVVASLVSDFRRLMAFIPGEVKARLTGTIEGDPLPPVTAVSIYDDAYFLGATVENRRVALASTRDRMAQQLMGLFPEPLDRGRLQALLNAHPEIGARFPGGMVEVAQIARQFPQEVLEAVLGILGVDRRRDERMNDPMEEGRVPGGDEVFMPEVESVAEALDAGAAAAPDGEAGERHDVSFFPVRVLQNLLGRLWGRNVEADESSDSDSGVEAGQGVHTDDVD